MSRVALFLALATFLLSPVRAQVPADTILAAAAAETATDAADATRSLRVRPIVSVGALYSGSRGVGIGGGVAVSNLARGGDHLQVEGRLSQRSQGVFGAYQTGEPEQVSLYALVGASGVTSTRFPFFGTGPHTDPAGRLFLSRTHAEVEGRLGWSPGGPGGLLLQPTVRYRVDRLRGFEQIGDSTLADVSASDQARIAALIADGTRSGVSIGLSAITDSRDNDARPSRGEFLQGSAARFFSTDGSGLGFNRFEALGYVFRPAPVRLPFQPERGAVFVRVSGIVVRQDGAPTLPLIYLPVLERDLLMGWPARDFRGRDALSVGLGMRGVLIPSVAAFRVEGIALALIGAGYDDVFREFTPRLSLSDAPVAEGERVPLQPSVGVGVNLHYRNKERPLVGALLGVGPGGITLTALRLVIGLDRYLPEVR